MECSAWSTLVTHHAVRMDVIVFVITAVGLKAPADVKR
jgi:hypothetical protein